MSTCFFIGHASTGSEVYPKLYESVERHIVDLNVKEFVVGKYGSFDRMAAMAVSELKKQYAGIRLSLLLPYHPGTIRSENLGNIFDELLYPFEKPVPPRFAIVKANNLMIRRSDYLICYVRYIGKSSDFLQTARQRERRGLIQIENLYDEMTGKERL